MKSNIIIRRGSNKNEVVVKDKDGTPHTFDLLPMNKREREHVRRSLVNHWCHLNDKPQHFDMEG